MGKAYSAVLSVSGGTAPYSFAVDQGALPSGLALNRQTGNISGDPNRAGTFQFTILVTGSGGSSKPSGGPVPLSDSPTLSDSGTRAFTMVVGPCTTCADVQISPADAIVGAGGKVQFAATVANSSNSAVTWSANAGTISSSGLFVAPANTTAQTIQILATSVSQPAAKATATVTLTSSSPSVPRITTLSVPAASSGVPYTTSLIVSAGDAPYHWSLVSGSLPSGLKLNSATGVISGSSTQVGTSTFTVSVNDASSHTAQQILTLPVLSSSQCGQPYCSRTDFAVVQVPPAVPNVGNLTGANRVVTDPDFGSRIARVTDWNTDPELPASSRFFVSASSGGTNENLFNTDSTLLVLSSTGAAVYPFTFDPSSMHAARMYVSSYPASGGLRLPGGVAWSRVNPNLLYSFSGTAVESYDFTDRTNAPSPQAVFDFTSLAHCLPAGFQMTWSAKAGVSAGDTVFGMAFSSTGGQGTGTYAVAYKVGSGCSMLNTQTGKVTGDWGVDGTISIPDRWTIHSAKMSEDGNWMIVSSTNCTSSSCAIGPYFWQLGTSNVTACQAGEACGGHPTEGYSHWINNNNSPIGNEDIRSLSDISAFRSLTSILPPDLAAPLDQHPSWNNADPADSVPFLTTTWSPSRFFPAPWYNEILGVATDGSGKVWRFAHSFITSKSQIFSTLYGIGSVSQDGRYFLLSSDWMGTLGSQSGATTCTIGQDCRGDVFVVELK